MICCIDELRPLIIEHQMKLLKEFPWQKDGSNNVYHRFLEYLRVSDLLKWNSELSSSCLMAMNDRGLASEVRSLFSFFSQFDENISVELSLLCIVFKTS